MNTPRPDLTTREKIVIWLILWAIQILAPWDYSHEHKEHIEALRNLVK
jgi:hypothetical protein